MGEKDVMLKNYFTPERFADMFNAVVFRGRRVVDPGKITPGEKETDEVKVKGKDVFANWRFRDIIKVAELPDAVYCLMAIEHQIKAEHEMPVRIMEYDAREYLRQMREERVSKLKPVITLVVYWESDTWPYSTTLHEMFDETAMEFLEKTGTVEYLSDYKMNIFIPKAATKDELERFGTDLKFLMTYVRYSDDKNKLIDYARKNDIVLNAETVTIINKLTNSNLKIEEGMEKVHMCKALDDLIEDGRIEGRNEGIVALISICREFGIEDNDIIAKVTERFSITKEEAMEILS